MKYDATRDSKTTITIKREGKCIVLRNSFGLEMKAEGIAYDALLFGMMFQTFRARYDAQDWVDHDFTIELTLHEEF